MEVNNVVAYITQLGFPIVMCGVLCWYIYKQLNVMMSLITEIKVGLAECKDAIKDLKGD